MASHPSPLTPHQSRVTPHQSLIIGGGISGITAAVELAEAGRKVVLVEREPYLGGNVSSFNNYFPKLCPPACGLEINYGRIRSNRRITTHTGAEVKEITGREGDFRAKVALQPQMINDRCTACGKCAEVCPEERPLEPGSGVAQKAAYINGGLAFPMRYTIDPEVCSGTSCGKCLEVCQYDAIELDARSTTIEIQAHRIIVATGWQPYAAEKLENYRYTEEPDVVTNLEFEKMLAACTRENKKLTRPSDGKEPGNIAFVQCAGSRDINHLPYCSAVCCPASVKHALTLSESMPGVTTELFYIDLRLTGRNEKLLKQAENKTTPHPSPSPLTPHPSPITFTKGKVGRINRGEDGGLLLEVEDIMAGKRRIEPFDMVVLATGIVPNPQLPLLSTNEYGFCDSKQVSGIYPAATCKRPMDVSSSVKDATSAAIKTMHKDEG
ncbi:MAG: FAD-dependent oxidoreductase [Bacteroidota bacterium]